MAFRRTIDTTYADLRPSDLVIDKSGQAWPLDPTDIAGDAERVGFWLCDPVTKVKLHYMTKLRGDPVKVSRLPTQADEASKLEAEFPPLTNVEVIKPENRKPGDVVVASVPDAALSATMAVVRESAWTTESIEAGVATIKNEIGVTMAEAVAAVEENVYANAVVSLAEAVAAVEEIGGTVEAEVTAAEVDAAAAATDEAPLTIIPFADMTPLEARSHLYLLHGVYGHDLQGKAELAALHDQAHAATAAGTLNSRHVPHAHEVA